MPKLLVNSVFDFTHIKMAEEIKLSPIHEAAKRGYVDQMEEILEKLTNQAEKEKLISSADTYGNT